MTDLPTWSISLGRWSGVQIRIHLFLILFAAEKLLNAAVVTTGHPVGATAAWLSLLLIALICHELGHAIAASIQNVEIEDIRLYPLGNLVMPGPSKAGESLVVASSGLITSGALAIASAIFLRFAGLSMDFSLFGSGPDPGAPKLAGVAIAPFSGLWAIGWFGHINWVIFLMNLLPALPLDGGRIFRRYLARNSVGLTRDNPYAQWMARAVAAVLLLVGLVRIVSGSVDNGGLLLVLALLIEMIVRTETRMLEDGGFFEDGVFGYDFSEGYTSLEAGAAKVRPYRESAIKRWRRKRSDFRRQRRIAREAAEERRMDEILEKLYLHGKAALTDEEHRFLVRVSAKIRSNRPRAK